MKILRVAIIIGLAVFAADKVSISRAGGSGVEEVAVPDQDISVSKKILLRYKTPVKMKVEKVFKPSWDEAKTSKGDIYLADGKFYLNITRPEKSKLVYDKETMWVETRTKVGIEDKIQVLQIESKEVLKKGSLMMAALFGQEDFWKAFKVIKVTDVKLPHSKEEHQVLLLDPIKGHGPEEVVQLIITFNKTKKTIHSFSYKDDLTNQTTYTFKKTFFKQKIKASKFKYKVPKNATVSKH